MLIVYLIVRGAHRLSAGALGALLAAEHVPLHRVKVVLPILCQTPIQQI